MHAKVNMMFGVSNAATKLQTQACGTGTRSGIGHEQKAHRGPSSAANEWVRELRKSLSIASIRLARTKFKTRTSLPCFCTRTQIGAHQNTYSQKFGQHFSSSSKTPAGKRKNDHCCPGVRQIDPGSIAARSCNTLCKKTNFKVP